MAKVRVFAKVKAKPGREQDVREKLLELVKASRAEEGVVFYELYETTDGGEFLFSEEYADTEAFESHKSSAPFKKAGQELPELIDGELLIWEVDPVEPVL